jgi:hypothetical protein
MPRPNAFVATIESSSPPFDRAEAELARRVSLSVQFAGDQVVRLDAADSRSPIYARVLDDLRMTRRPAYVEFDPATRAIRLLLLPLVSRVLNISTGEDVEVQLEQSHGIHLLKRASPYFEEFLAILREALARGNSVAVTDEDQEIIDVRPYAAPVESIPGGASPPEPTGPRGLMDWLRRLVRCLRCISAQRAKQMFDMCAARSCNPVSVPPPCIPFLYPDDGCWARAHEMCRLMIAQGVYPRKVWSSGSLRVNTRNNPKCFVTWGWHVAPTLCVRTRYFFTTEELVIDPSLFSGPVSKQTWKNIQSATAQLMDSDWTLFRRPNETDPGFVKTQATLQTYRNALALRSANNGPPPYAQCP